MKEFSFRNIKLQFNVVRFLIIFIIVLTGALNILAQSTNQNSPTPIKSNEIEGEIKPRAIGDPRLTNYFYTFNGNQGDVFINVVTSNLDGDIDVFTFDNLEPLTKIPVFSGVAENETGRVIYLRKSAKLILRVQGRSPNDEPAKFQLKFAGSFVPSDLTADNSDSELPSINTNSQDGRRVNSVGTIIEVVPKTTPKPVDTVADKVSDEQSADSISEDKSINLSTSDDKIDEKNVTKIEIRKEQEDDEISDTEAVSIEDESDDLADNSNEGQDNLIEAPTVIVTDSLDDLQNSTSIKSDADKIGSDLKGKSDADRSDQPKAKPIDVIIENVEEDEKVLKDENSVVIENTGNAEIQPVEAEKLANIQLVVNFKNGTKFKRSMDRVTWFNVDKGILTIITDDGNTLKFSMLDVIKVTFEAE